MSRYQRRKRLQQLLEEDADTADNKTVYHDPDRDVFQELNEDEVQELFEARRRRKRGEEEEEVDDRIDNTGNEEEEEDEEDDDDYGYTDPVIRNNELDRNKHEYTVSKIITQADRTVEQQAQDLLYKDDLPNFWEGGIVVFFHLYKTGGSSVTE